MARNKANILDLLTDTSSGQQQAPTTKVIDLEMAQLLVTAWERLDAFKDNAERKEMEFKDAKNVTERWRMHGFVEAVELAHEEMRELWSNLLDTEREYAEAVMRRIAKGKQA